RDVPRGHQAEEGDPQAVAGRGAYRRGSDRARGRRAPRARRHQGNRRPAHAPGLARPLRRADRPLRPRRVHSGRRGSHGDPPSDGSDRGTRGAAVTGVLLAVDGDSLAHRAYHAIPKSIRGNGRTANALVGVGNFLLQLWEAERPESVLVGWDSLETPTYRHEALPAYQSGR